MTCKRSVGEFLVNKITIRPKASLGSKILAAVAGLGIVATIGAPRLPSPRVELPQEIPGVVAPGVEPQACIGFNEMQKRWGAEWGYCPTGHAFFGNDDPAGDAGPAEKITVAGSCCKLPAQDILTEDHVFTTSECPLDYVATGSRHEVKGDTRTVYMRCTKINTGRYQLGEMTPGVYWGKGSAGWQGSTRILWENIPKELRFASGRETAEKWDIDGCVGYPWGSLLTKKESKHCAGFSFRQLQYRGAGNDPLAGTPVQMLPRCADVDPNDPTAASCRNS